MWSKKLWTWVTRTLLTVRTFDLFLQGALLIVILLEHHCFLLLRRTSDDFNISMIMEDYAIMGIGGLEFLAAAFVAWLGRNRRKLALSIWLAVTALIGLIVLVFRFKRENGPLAELCDLVPIPELSGATGSNQWIEEIPAAWRTVFLIATLALCALAKVSIWAHGLTYLDDKEPQNGAYFYGILISIQLSLGLSGKEWLLASANQADWQVAHICICQLTLMFAVLFGLFPGDPKHQDDHDDGFLPSLARVLKNKTVILQIGALGFLNIALFKFLHYESLFAQARFHVDTGRLDLRNSKLLSSIFRPIVIIFFIMIFCMRFSARGSEGVKAKTAARVGAVTALFAAALFVAIATIDCSPGPIAGLDGSTYMTPSCKDQQCFCNTERHGFIPVCGIDTRTTYYSPCEAGCTIHGDLNGLLVFFECSCDIAGITRGACSLPDCHVIYTLYQAFVTLVLAIAGAAMLMQGMSILRAVRGSDKPVAMGAMLAVVALTSQTLGHLAYFAIDQETCAYFKANRCEFHNPTIYLMGVVSAVCAALAAVASAAAAWCAPSEQQ